MSKLTKMSGMRPQDKSIDRAGGAPVRTAETEEEAEVTKGPLGLIKDVLDYDSPRFGMVEMTRRPTELDQLTKEVVDSLHPSLMRLWTGDKTDFGKAHAKLMPLEGPRFELMLRRLACKDGGKHLDSYINGLADSDPARLTELAGKLAETHDAFGAALLREHLSPEAWQSLLSARAGLDPDARGRFDQTMGTPVQIETTLAERASFAELRRHLNRDLVDSSPLVITDGEALAAHQHLMGSKHFASDVRRLAKEGEGVYLSRYVEHLDKAKPGKVAELARALIDLDPSVRGDTVRSALVHRALTALLRDLAPPERAALEKRLGGAAAVAEHLDLDANRQAVKDYAAQLVGETTAVAVTGGEWTRADQAWLGDVEQAMVRQDDAALGALLEAAGPKRFWKLWEEVPAIWARHPDIKPSEDAYLETLQTSHGEAWSVRWNNSTADDVKMIEHLSAALGAEVGSKLRGRLEYRKEFPVLDRDRGVLEGGSTYGFNGWENAEIGASWTPNSLQMGRYSGRPVAVMNYKERDHYTPEIRFGFSDMFMPITRNTVLSLGGQGFYADGKVPQDKFLVFFMQRCAIESGELSRD